MGSPGWRCVGRTEMGSREAMKIRPPKMLLFPSRQHKQEKNIVILSIIRGLGADIVTENVNLAMKKPQYAISNIAIIVEILVRRGDVDFHMLTIIF